MSDVKEAIVSRPAVVFASILAISIVVCRLIEYGSFKKADKCNLTVTCSVFEEYGYSEGDQVEVFGRIGSVMKKDKVTVELNRVMLCTHEDNLLLEKEIKKSTLVTGKGEKIQVALDNSDDIKMGQYIRVIGNLKYFAKPTNWGEFNSYAFYTNRGVICKVENAKIIGRSREFNVLQNKLWILRQRLEATIDELYEEDDAGLLKAMLLGVKSEIPKEVKESFQKSGISHLLAISGLHVSFLCMFVYKALTAMRLKRCVCIVTSEILLWLYIVMVGMPASAMRAGIMFSFFTISSVCKRSYDMLSAMAVSAVVLLAHNPWQLFDSAFQLSFLAIIAIGGFEKGMINNSRYLKKLLKMHDSNTLKGKIYNNTIIKTGYNLIASFSVFIVTLPVLLYCYFEVALYSVLLNLLIIPLMPFLLISGIASITLTEIVDAIGAVFAYASHFILELFKISCSYLERTGFGRRNIGRPSILGIVVFYLLIIVIVMYRYKFAALIKMVCLIGCLFAVSFHNNEGIYMLDVGQGECIVVIDKDEKAYMFDGGSSSRKNIAENVIIPFLKSMGVNEIAAIFLSHPDEDHINGIDALLTKANHECMQIDGLYMYSESVKRGEYEQLIPIALDSGVEINAMKYADRLCSNDVEVECIYPLKYQEGESNNNSLVLKIYFEDIVMLETGDLEMKGEASLVGSDVSADIFKIGHHGSSTSTSEEFLTKVKPKIALISAGRNNSYGHPHKETIELLNSYDLPYYCTKTFGAIRVYRKNKIWKLETFM